MDNTEHGALLVNSVLNFLNLALAAWILQKQKDTRKEVRKNTRITTEAADSANQVKEKTNGVMEALLARLERAAVDLDRARELNATKPKRRKPARKKPPPKR